MLKGFSNIKQNRNSNVQKLLYSALYGISYTLTLRFLRNFRKLTAKTLEFYKKKFFA